MHVGKSDSTSMRLVVGLARAAFLVAGSTVAIHRLALRIGPAGERRSLWAAVAAAFEADREVLDALAHTVVLAAAAVAIATVLGSLVAGPARVLAARGRELGAGRPALGSGLVLALAVPGLALAPVARWAADHGLVPTDGGLAGTDGGLGGADGGLVWANLGIVDRAPIDTIQFLGFWSLLVGLAVAPTVVATLSGARVWELPGPAGHPALARQASSPPVEGRWRVVVPTATLGLALASAEVLSGLPGLFGRFTDEAAAGRSELLVPLALPVIVAGVVLLSAVGVGDRLLGGPGSPLDTRRPGQPGRGGAAQLAVPAALCLIVAGVTVAGAAADASTTGLAVRTARAIGLGLAASAFPATAATVVGAGLAWFRRTGGRGQARVLDTALGLLCWPLALVVPLAAWATGPVAVPVVDPLVLVITAMALIPAATQLLRPRLDSGRVRTARLAAVAARLAALAFAAHLLAGFVGPDAAGGRATLGELLREGWSTAGVEAPLLMPAVAATSVAAALLWIAALIAAQPTRLVDPASPAGAAEGGGTADLVIRLPTIVGLEPGWNGRSGTADIEHVEHVEDDARQTVELRPANFRGAGQPRRNNS